MKNILLIATILYIAANGAQAAPNLSATGVEFAQGTRTGTEGVLWRIAQVEPNTGKAEKGFGEGMMAGQMAAQNYGTGGKFIGGFVTGFLTGLIGTGIGYFIVGPAQIGAMEYGAMQKESSEYQMGFRSAFEEKTKARKRSAFLGGGLGGTAVFLLLVFGA